MVKKGRENGEDERNFIILVKTLHRTKIATYYPDANGVWIHLFKYTLELAMSKNSQIP